MLKQRVVTAVVGVLGVFLMLFLHSNVPWHLLVDLATLVAFLEFNSMFGATWKSGITWIMLLFIFSIQWTHDWAHPFVLFCFAAAALLWPVLTKNKVPLSRVATLFVGSLYVGYGGACLIHLRELSHGYVWIWVFLVCIWMTDTCAYFTGRFFKGPKLWPSISPNKTVSGAIGGVVGGMISAAVFGLFAFHHAHIFIFLLLGFVISVTGQLGDFVESAYKRETGVKDSGKVLPGHGGMLDRIDSLLFAAPFALYLLSSGHMTWYS